MILGSTWVEIPVGSWDPHHILPCKTLLVLLTSISLSPGWSHYLDESQSFHVKSTGFHHCNLNSIFMVNSPYVSPSKWTPQMEFKMNSFIFFGGDFGVHVSSLFKMNSPKSPAPFLRLRSSQHCRPRGAGAVGEGLSQGAHQAQPGLVVMLVMLDGWVMIRLISFGDYTTCYHIIYIYIHHS